MKPSADTVNSLGSLIGGAEFHLSLELGLVGADTHCAAALTALWTCPMLSGPWASADAVGAAGRQGSATERLDTKRWRFGLLRMGAAAPSLPFVAHLIREKKTSAEQRAATIQFGIQIQEPSDWLTLGIPVRALCSSWSIDNSWVAASQPWLPSLCRVLAGIADHIHQRAGILGGVMGEEASGCWRHPTPSRLQEAHQSYPPARRDDRRSHRGTRRLCPLSRTMGAAQANR